VHSKLDEQGGQEVVTMLLIVISKIKIEICHRGDESQRVKVVWHTRTRKKTIFEW